MAFLSSSTKNYRGSGKEPQQYSMGETDKSKIQRGKTYSNYTHDSQIATTTQPATAYADGIRGNTRSVRIQTLTPQIIKTGTRREEVVDFKITVSNFNMDEAASWSWVIDEISNAVKRITGKPDKSCNLHFGATVKKGTALGKDKQIIAVHPMGALGGYYVNGWYEIKPLTKQVVSEVKRILKDMEKLKGTHDVVFFTTVTTLFFDSDVIVLPFAPNETKIREEANRARRTESSES